MVTPNPKQQECIDNIDGKVLVLAGPGTGKTFTIVQRIKSMIKNKGISPEKILCLTFTEAAAGEMKNRIDKELDKLDSGVNVYTYHSFCNEIIQENSDEFEIPENYRIISEPVAKAFIKNCIDEINPVAYRTDKNDPYFYIKEIKNGINNIKQYRLTKEKYFYNLEHNPNWKPQLNELKLKRQEKIDSGKKVAKSLEDDIKSLEKNIAKAAELWDFYELYIQKTEQNHYIDFNDMISMVLEKFENNSGFLEKIANKYEYILVDEYQDTNKSQNDIVFALTKALKSENVFVVGDDDQIIYSFQGAKLDTIEKFLLEFPETKVICLTENMRSTQSILDAAREIAKQDNKRLEVNPKFVQYNITKSLTAKNEKVTLKDSKVRCYKYADVLQEYNEIVREIDDIINSDNCPKDDKGNKLYSEIAILAKSNAELETFAQMFKDRNIPYELKEGKNIFSIKSTIAIIYYMQALVNPELNSDKLFKLLLLPPFSVSPKDYETIAKSCSNNKAFIDCLTGIPSENLENYLKIKQFTDTFEYLQKYRTNETLRNTILEIGAKTGIFDYYLNSDINRTENIAGIKKLIDEACAFSDINKIITLDDFVQYLEISLNDDIEIRTDKAPQKLNAIQLSTYHSAKGKEYEIVYMPTVINYKWESNSKSQKINIPLSPLEAKNEEQLKEQKISDCIKVMYVGMTRAKHTLRISYYFNPNRPQVKPSQFITNIQEIFEKEPTPFIYDEQSFWDEIHKSIVKKDYDYKKDFSSFVDSKLAEKPFSASSINKYLACPRQYFYKYILNLESKAGNPNNMSYGSAVHCACEYAIKFAKENNFYPAKENFINVFKTELSKLPMSDYQQRQIYEQRGEDKLAKFYPQLCVTPVSMLYDVENKFSSNTDNIDFVGYIDRVDKNPDGTYTIYDYKTGNAKGKNDIKFGGKHEDYYIQMGLYKYYFEQTTGKKVKETTFIFPEDFEKNLTIVFSEQDCEAVYNKLKSTVSDIRSQKFEPVKNRSKLKAPCQYCPFSDFCEIDII